MQLDIHPFNTVAKAIASSQISIDTAAGAARARYITVAVGQDATYAAKYQNACAYRAAGYLPADATGFPWVQGEAAGTGVTPSAAAAGILAAGDLWNNTKGPQIEGIRIGGKAALSSLTTIAAVLAAAYTTINTLNGV